MLPFYKRVWYLKDSKTNKFVAVDQESGGYPYLSTYLPHFFNTEEEAEDYRESFVRKYNLIPDTVQLISVDL